MMSEPKYKKGELVVYDKKTYVVNSVEKTLADEWRYLITEYVSPGEKVGYANSSICRVCESGLEKKND